MSEPSFHAFAAQARARGHDELVERRWAPGTVVETHTHPLAVTALVVQGRMWLACGGATREPRPGDSFELARDEPHAERYGDEGATYWVGRRG